jgi:hydroxypyruvate reductase
MKLTELFAATIARLDPAQLVAGALADLDWAPHEVTIVAAGKAAVGMTAGAAAMLGDHLVGGVIVAPEAGDAPNVIDLVVGAHPVPDERSVAAARALLGAARDVPPGRQVLALISGGASALVAMPPDGVALADQVAAVSAVYASGAPIGELNTVRKHISAIKGGRLARAAAGPVTTLVLSDVVGDDMADVGSGPTIPDPTTRRARRRCRRTCRCGRRGRPRHGLRGRRVLPRARGRRRGRRRNHR